MKYIIIDIFLLPFAFVGMIIFGLFGAVVMPIGIVPLLWQNRERGKSAYMEMFKSGYITWTTR